MNLVDVLEFERPPDTIQLGTVVVRNVKREGVSIIETKAIHPSIFPCLPFNARLF
jgi:hypothetical protein